ncbi:MAG: GNAT family N-acetyltransferase [Alphaproteobacteria bacterium]|nr:GNAT family N-acetyltransferase [Alphaproteobacteria bacterium]
MIDLRERRDGDDERIAFVVRRAFAGEDEVKLIADLRADGDMLLEVVAEREGAGIVGHVAFSRLSVRSIDRELRAAALAPLAVLPTHQRQGIGQALVQDGLRRLQALNVELIVVLGDPAYYARFGFSALLARLLQAPYSGDGFQALELQPGALGKRAWDATYPPAFSKMS